MMNVCDQGAHAASIHKYTNLAKPDLTQTDNKISVGLKPNIHNKFLPEIVQKPGKANLRTLPKFNYTYELIQNKFLML